MSNFARRKQRQAILVITALLMLSACTGEGQVPNATPGPPSDQPPAFNGSISGGNIQRTGVYDGSGGSRFGDRLWKYKAEYWLSTDVVVAAGLAFLGVSNYGLHAIDIKTGEVKYTLDSYRSVPTVADGVLYYNGNEGLHAMDLATKKDNWVFKSGGGEGSSPAVHDGVVYFGGGTDPSGIGEGKGYLFAVDAKSGQEKWRFQGGIVSAPAIGDGLIYFLGGETIWRADVGDFRGVLYAIDLQTGKEVWRKEPASTQDQSGTYGSPIYYDGLVYSANSYNAYLGPGHVYAFDAKTGKEVWKQTTEDELWDPEIPVAYNGSIYVAASVPRYPPGQSGEGPLHVFDAKTGKPKWTFRADSWVNAPAISNGTLYLASGSSSGNRGALYSLDPATGQQLDKIEFEDAINQSPVISDGVVYLAGHSYEPVLEDVLIAVATLPASPAEGSSGATPAAATTSQPIATINGALYKGNLQRTGQYQTTGVPTVAGERWAFRTGGSVTSSPVEVGGIVYAGSDDGSMYALAADSGRLRWEYKTRGGVSSSPTVADGRVFFGGDDGDIYALDSLSGRELWKFKTSAGVVASPLVANGMVLCGSRDGSFYALDASTGQRLWANKAEGTVSTSAALANDTAFYGDTEGFFHAVDVNTGLTRWKYEGQSAVASAPAVLNGVVYFGNRGGQLIALDAGTGTEKWAFKLGTAGRNSGSPSVTGSPAIAGDIVYFGGEDGALYAVNVNSAQQVWKVGTDAAINSAPSLAGTLLFAGSDDGNLYALDSATGNEQWRFKAGAAITTSPAIGDGILYFGSDDGGIYALQSPTMAARPTHTASAGEAATRQPQPSTPAQSPGSTLPSPAHSTVAMTQGGPQHVGVYAGPPLEEPVTTLWDFNAGENVNIPPVVADGVVYFSSGDGRVYAVDAQTGLEKWSAHSGTDKYLSPAVSGGLVYLGSTSGTLYAYDAQSGKEKWHVSAPIPYTPLTISGNTIYFGSDDRNVYALDAGTGAVRWKFQTGDSVDSTPSVVDGVVYVGGRSNAVFAIDAATGKQLWRFDTSNFVHNAPAVAGGMVYFGNWSGDFYAVDAKSGKQVWHFDAQGSIYNDIGVSDGIVYFGTNSDNFYALDAKTGEAKWSFPKDENSTHTGEFKAPAIVDGMVYAVSEWEGVFAFDKKTGELKWQYKVGFAPTAPYIADGVLYVGDHGFPSHVYAIK